MNSARVIALFGSVLTPLFITPTRISVSIALRYILPMRSRATITTPEFVTIGIVMSAVLVGVVEDAKEEDLPPILHS